MLASIKTTLKKSPSVRHAYARVRSVHDRYEGGKLFENGDEYARAMYHKGSDGTVLRMSRLASAGYTLRTDGKIVSARRP